jgi:hypothetical protein
MLFYATEELLTVRVTGDTSYFTSQVEQLTAKRNGFTIPENVRK